MCNVLAACVCKITIQQHYLVESEFGLYFYTVSWSNKTLLWLGETGLIQLLPVFWLHQTCNWKQWFGLPDCVGYRRQFLRIPIIFSLLMRIMIQLMIMRIGMMIMMFSVPMCVVPAGVVPAVWQALPLPHFCAPVSLRSPAGAGWLPLLPGVCPAAGRALHRDVSLRQPERTAVRLQRQFPRRPRGVCQWVPLLTSKQPGAMFGWVGQSEADTQRGGDRASVSLHERDKQTLHV